MGKLSEREKLLEKKYKFLKDISSLKKNERDKYINSCGAEHIHVISEAIYNALKQPCKRKNGIAQKYKKELRNLANLKFAVGKKRSILTDQVGGGIFSIIASVVLPLIANLLFKKKK